MQKPTHGATVIVVILFFFFTLPTTAYGMVADGSVVSGFDVIKLIIGYPIGE